MRPFRRALPRNHPRRARARRPIPPAEAAPPPRFPLFLPGRREAVQLLEPVRDQMELTHDAAVGRLGDRVKALSIGSDVVARDSGLLEEQPRLADLRLCSVLEPDRVETGAFVVEDLETVARPSRKAAAPRRDVLLVAELRILLDVDLEDPGLNRRIREPPAVGRDHGVSR